MISWLVAFAAGIAILLATMIASVRFHVVSAGLPIAFVIGAITTIRLRAWIVTRWTRDDRIPPARIVRGDP
ncbi:MAG TPA: hypothetical protein VGC41_12470 [Kofleriaceae bacterium]